ncbi:Pyruvate decarboxylase 1 [Linum perenne]
MCSAADPTLGRHLARRLVQIGITDVFSVPGDFNLTLLDHLIAEPRLNVIGCCNELNAGYAADGYARSRGVSACVVTFTVGGLSVINAISGAYSRNLPVICIVGGPNSNDYGTNRILHHTIGVPDFSQELRCFQAVTAFQAVVNHLEDAHELIDRAISTALKQSKPVYISLSCNLPAIPHSSFLGEDPVPFSLIPKQSNQIGLEAAVEAAAELLNAAAKPVMIGGPEIRLANARKVFVEMSDSCGYAIGVVPSGKGLVPEDHPKFVTTGSEIVQSGADAYLFVGVPVYNDLVVSNREKAVIVQPERVAIGNGPAFGCIVMEEFLKALTPKLTPNSAAHDEYLNSSNPEPEDHGSDDQSQDHVKAKVFFKHVEKMLSSGTALITETGQWWRFTQKLKLPNGCEYEYGSSMGWTVGASLGYAQAAMETRVIACVEDRKFQETVQDVSTMMRCGQKSIIFVMVMVDEKSKYCKRWDYTGIVDAIHNGEGKCWTKKVNCEAELVEAIEIASGEKKDCLCFIEVKVEADQASEPAE